MSFMDSLAQPNKLLSRFFVDPGGEFLKKEIQIFRLSKPKTLRGCRKCILRIL